MRPRARGGSTGSRCGAFLAAALLALAIGSGAAAADDAAPVAGPMEAPAAASPARGTAWLSVGLLAGGMLADSRLADYQWDTSPRPAWGAQALAGRGPLACGARLWSAQTTQRIDLPGSSVEPRVRLTSVELVGMGRVATLGSSEILISGDVGRLHLGYDPDQITLPGPGIPIIVQFSAVDEWTGGGGVGVRRGFGPRWSLALGVEHDFFGLDTAHRSGAAVVYGRESLGDWSAHLEVARRFQL
jgi:opacity protein-like surface antigen